MTGPACDRAPAGWRCIRGAHLAQEPCAAVPAGGVSWPLRLALWALSKLGRRAALAADAARAELAGGQDRWFG